ncbi:MAG: TrbI/VirB10 family protein [Bryobacteraceae bacterium]
MPEETQPDIKPAGPPSAPDPEKLKPVGLSNTYKRYIYWGVTAVLALLILANIVGPKQSVRTTAPNPSAPVQKENPSPAQIRDWENSLKQAEAQLEQQQKDRQRQLDAARLMQQKSPLTPEEQLQRAEALSEAAMARQQYEQRYGNGTGQYGQAQQKSQAENEREQQAYKSLFADNVVRQDTNRTFRDEPAAKTAAATSEPTRAAARQEPESKAAAEESKRKPLDFDLATQPRVWLPEGTVIEAVLTNRLDGDAVGPVDCMITGDVYQPGTRVLLVPQGARVLGEASAVSSFGQSRLAVAFHRIIVPGLHAYSIPLDKPMPALSQAGDVGLHDKVNNHYASVFGASLAIGAIGGLAQIGNGYSGFGYDPSVEIRNGITQSMAQSSSRILDRFLNRMPTVTIREGTRVKVILTDDLQLPTYDSMRKGDL